MLRYYCSVLIFILCLTYKVNAEFPDDPKPCKHGDSECLINIINYLFREKNQGDSSINLAKLEPLEVKKIALKQGAESPVNIDLVFINTSIIGLSAAKAIKVSGFGKDMTQEHEIVLKANIMQFVGSYKVDGRILILPIKGSGNSNITMVNANVTLKFVGTPIEKDGEKYMKVDKFTFDVEPERLIFKIDNLFNGDKALGDNMNLFLNENWPDIYREIKGTFEIAFGKIFKKIINQVFSKRPYDKYFIE